MFRAAFVAPLSLAIRCPSLCRSLSPLRPPLRPHRAASPAARPFFSTTPAMTASDHLKEGDTVPSVTFKTRVRVPELEGKTENPFDWKDMTSEDYFKGKRVVLFALPGAFTPTCSTTHLPGYERDFDAMRAAGVDDVLCLSVNDAFVMYRWGLSQNADKVTLVPDGAALFTRGMNMTCTWTSERGFGERSWRYSMVVKDMVIEKMFVEPDYVENSGPDPFEVSDSTTMLNYLKSVA